MDEKKNKDEQNFEPVKPFVPAKPTETNEGRYEPRRIDVESILYKKNAAPVKAQAQIQNKNDAEQDKNKSGFMKFFTANNYKNAKITAIVVAVVLVICACGVVGWIYWSTRSEGYGDEGIDYFDETDEDYLSDEIYRFNSMGDDGAGSLNEFLRNWANNGGDKMYDKNIINVLLCGIDNSDDLDKKLSVAAKGRSDALMLVSVDKKNEKITITSLFRDTWTYMKLPKDNGSYEESCAKINAAYMFGGPATLIETVENDYKIKIDQYIAVDFQSFPKLIDAVGGVTVDVKDYEAQYIRRTSSHTDFPSGDGVTLDGDEALVFSRIRHLDVDEDVSRTRRQRMVIKGLIDSAKSATKGQLLNAFKQVSDYMRTGYTQTEVISLIAQATAHDWMSFPMTELTLPNEDGVDSVGGYIGSQWAWAVDFPVCAQKLQKAIYGETNINLEPDRLTIVDYMRGNTHKTSSNSSSGSRTTTGRTYDDDDDTTAYTHTVTRTRYDDDETTTSSRRTTESQTSSSSRTTTHGSYQPQEDDNEE